MRKRDRARTALGSRSFMAERRQPRDANVLSQATKPRPDPRVVDWLTRTERGLVVDPTILGELRFGILLLPRGQRRCRSKTA